MIPSKAHPDDIDQYTQGSCHILAVALQRHLGWQIEVVRQDDEIWWQDDHDPDNFITAVLHVYAISPDGQAWDIRGVRPEGDIPGEIQNQYHCLEISSDTCRNEGELSTYVGTMEDEHGEQVELPLWSYTDQDVNEAWQVGQRTLSHLPGFIPAPRKMKP